MLWFGKKGYLRTLEVLIAFVITFSFLAITMTSPIITKNDKQENVLSKLAFDVEFREEVIKLQGCEEKSDNTKITNITSTVLNYNFVICKNKKPELPLKNVYVDSVYITGNVTNINLDPIKLYYWN